MRRVCDGSYQRGARTQAFIVCQFNKPDQERVAQAKVTIAIQDRESFLSN